MLKDYSWQSSGYYMGCQRLNLDGIHAKQYPAYCTILFPRLQDLYWGNIKKESKKKKKMIKSRINLLVKTQ